MTYPMKSHHWLLAFLLMNAAPIENSPDRRGRLDLPHAPRSRLHDLRLFLHPLIVLLIAARSGLLRPVLVVIVRCERRVCVSRGSTIGHARPEAEGEQGEGDGVGVICCPRARGWGGQGGG